MPRRTFHPRRGSVPESLRRKTAWDLGPGGDDLATLDIQSVSSDTTVILGSGITPTVDPLTIVRVRGHLSLRLDTATAAGDGFNWVAGMGIVSNDAFAIGQTAMPNPFDDSVWPGWMWMASGSMHTAVGGLSVGDPSNNPIDVPIDARAMRKLGLNEIVFISLQGGENATANLSVAAYTRVLFKLP